MEPVIRNEQGASNPLLGPADGVSTYVMLYVKHEPGESSPDHVHDWEHQAFITEGSGILVFGGEEYPIKTGDAVIAVKYPLIIKNVGMVARPISEQSTSKRMSGRVA